MSDDRVRELERRWQETSCLKDEAAFLLERLRIGDLSEEGLELAAYCGHEAAMALRPHVRHESRLAQLVPERPFDHDPWIVGLSRWGAKPGVVAVAAGLRLTAATLQDAGCLDASQAMRAAAQASEIWARCESATTADAVEAIAKQEESVLGSYPAGDAVRSLCALIRPPTAASGGTTTSEDDGLGWFIGDAVWMLSLTWSERPVPERLLLLRDQAQRAVAHWALAPAFDL